MAAGNESHSSQISIKQVSPEKGKGLFANTNFKEGDIIFEEKPLVCCQFLWNAMYKYIPANSHALGVSFTPAG